MAFLSLTNDELALLRFTGDLHFVEESPLWPLESEAIAPVSYEDAYRSLTERGLVDPHTFRLTDDALNRIAPVTECDGRVVHLQRGGGDVEQHDYYLLDEIAVRFVDARQGVTVPEAQQLFGEDFDASELVEHFARRVLPRRAAGDLLDVQLRPIEMLALSLIAPPFRDDNVEFVTTEAAIALLGAPPKDTSDKRSHTLESAFLPHKRPRMKTPPPSTADFGAAAWDEAFRGLSAKGIVVHDGDRLALRPAITDLVRAIGDAPRHSFVRYDFGDDDWLVRECTLIPLDGSLFEVTQANDGMHRLRELNGERLRGALMSAIGPLPRPDLDLDDETMTFVRAQLPQRAR